MKNIILATVAASLLSFGINAQEKGNQCGTDQALENLHKKYPQLKAEYELNQELLANSAVKSGEKAVSYQIPVVFHIIHEYGSENVSDSRVYDLMETINADFSATNADIVSVVPAFQPLIGDAEIQFKLAAIDPIGDCTNGIQHIYSHETNLGDDNSKLSRWNRAKYMNVWVVDNIGSGSGTLGYAYFPSSTDGNGFWIDGIIILSATVNGTSRTLTHEIGHYLGLPHTFGGEAGDGICGDDGLADTPPTDGGWAIYLYSNSIHSSIVTLTPNKGVGMLDRLLSF